MAVRLGTALARRSAIATGTAASSTTRHTPKHGAIATGLSRRLTRTCPLDQFLQLQIAGDLVGDRHAAVATGFFAHGQPIAVMAVIPTASPRPRRNTLRSTDTLARGMLGLTLACSLPRSQVRSLAAARLLLMVGDFYNTDVQDAPLAASEVVVAFNQHQQAIGKLDQQIKDQQNKITKEAARPALRRNGNSNSGKRS